MLQHEEIEGAGIGENPPHNECIGDRPHPIGKAERAVRREEAHLGQIAPGNRLGRRGISVDLGEFDLACPAGEELDHRDVVYRRVGVRQGDHRRAPAGGSGSPSGLYRFHVLGTGLAQLDAHVDEPWSQA